MAKDFESLSLVERHKLERAYQLGKTDIDPRTGKTAKESREDYVKMDAEYEEGLAKQVENFDHLNLPVVPATEPFGVGQFTADDLAQKTKAELVAIAEGLGIDSVPDTHTKVEIIQMILSHG